VRDRGNTTCPPNVKKITRLSAGESGIEVEGARLRVRETMLLPGEELLQKEKADNPPPSGRHFEGGRKGKKISKGRGKRQGLPGEKGQDRR